MVINVDMIYPIGSLYITTSTVSPEVSFGGTWTQITDDAYLKIVNTSGAVGILGGTSSQHKIPLASTPSHSHWVLAQGHSSHVVLGNATWGWNDGVIPKSSNTAGDHITTDKQGGNQPYYPYYYGVYVWKRTA